MQGLSGDLDTENQPPLAIPFAHFVVGVAVLLVGGGVLLVGFWLFAYNVARTLPTSGLDITEAHFAFALASLLAATVLGWLLAADVACRLLGGLFEPSELVLAHLTLTVFGFVFATIVGALYQLAPMFTQAEKTPVDAHLAHVEMVALPVGIGLLAAGRLFDATLVATVGGVLFLLGALAFAGFLGRQLWRARVEPGPLLRRYGLVTVSVVGWTVLTVPTWLRNPASVFARFGDPMGTHLLFVGVITLTILGTFYHVVPFIVWYHRYSDRLGYESVPMVDDLYDDRIERIEFWLLAVGLAGLWLGDLLSSTPATVVAGNLLGVAVLLFSANMAIVVRRHRPETLREVVATLAGRSSI